MSWKSKDYGRRRLIIIAHDAGVADSEDLMDMDPEGNSLGAACGSNIYDKLVLNHGLSHSRAVEILEGVGRYTDQEAFYIAATYS